MCTPDKMWTDALNDAIYYCENIFYLLDIYLVYFMTSTIHTIWNLAKYLID